MSRGAYNTRARFRPSAVSFFFYLPHAPSSFVFFSLSRHRPGRTLLERKRKRKKGEQKGKQRKAAAGGNVHPCSHSLIRDVCAHFVDSKPTRTPPQCRLTNKGSELLEMGIGESKEKETMLPSPFCASIFFCFCFARRVARVA